MKAKELILKTGEGKEERLAAARGMVERSGLEPDAILQAAWNNGLVLALAGEAIGVDLWKGTDAEARELHHRAMGTPPRTPWLVRPKSERRRATALVKEMQRQNLIFSPDSPENYN
jgi:hypothetical protein